MSAFSRSSSASGKLGLSATSATSRTISGPKSESESPKTRDMFWPTSMSSEPPIRAADSEICVAVFVVVPSRIHVPVRSPSQTSLAPSLAFPPSTARSRVSLGTVPY